MNFSSAHRSRPLRTVAAASLSVLLFQPTRLHAQTRDIGTGTNPAATTQNQTTPNGGNNTNLIGSGDSADAVVIVG